MPRIPGPLAVTLAALAVLAVLSGCTATPKECRTAAPTSAAPSPSSDSRFVTIDGASFEADGKPFRFVGVNIYDAAATDVYSCREGSRMSDARLENTLRYLHDEAGATVLRFWAYQTYTKGGTYWAGIDRVLKAARDNGMRVIPVLEDGPGDCTSSRTPKIQVDGDSWFTAGYREREGDAGLSYRDYVGRIAGHYKDDPTILGWSMMNEAETNARTSSGDSVLVDFAQDVGSVIHAADPNHLVTLGTQSNSAPGASGPDFTDVYSVPGISFAEVHDWGRRGSDTAAMPGSSTSMPPAADSIQCAAGDAPIACSFARAPALDKPLIVGEAGMVGTSERDRVLRAQRLGAKMDAAFAAGASGYLIWSVTGAQTDGFDVSISDHDPLIGRMERVASSIGRTGSTMTSPPTSCQD